jgi:CheY-like chemotaxis protein
VANELILIVEDNDKNRKLMRDVLTFKGYRLAEAGAPVPPAAWPRACKSLPRPRWQWATRDACPVQFDGVANVSNSVFASVRSAVSKPSVNQP